MTSCSSGIGADGEVLHLFGEGGKKVALFCETIGLALLATHMVWILFCYKVYDADENEEMILVCNNLMWIEKTHHKQFQRTLPFGISCSNSESMFHITRVFVGQNRYQQRK